MKGRDSREQFRVKQPAVGGSINSTLASKARRQSILVVVRRRCLKLNPVENDEL